MPRSQPGARRPSVVFQPAARRGIQVGTEKITSVLAPSLGPLPRKVAVIHRHDRNRAELLDGGGEIVRRVLQLEDRTEDVGAMFLRECLWRQHQQFGDGATTAAVLFQAVFTEGVRYIAAGGNAMRLRTHLNKGLHTIAEALSAMCVEVEEAEQLVALARTISHDEPLARMLGEIMADIGEFGRLEIREGQTEELRREHVEGLYWERGLMSRQMAADQRQLRTDLADAAILISDLEIDELHQLTPLLALALDAGIRRLFIVAQRLSDNVIGFLLANNHPDRFQVIAVSTPGMGVDQAGELDDLAVATGGRPLLKVAGDTLQRVRLQDLGRAERMWADIHNFGIINGGGDPAAAGDHLMALFGAFERAEDPVLREKLRKRIARLQGGSVTLWVGGARPDAIKPRTELAERTAGLLREAMMYGVLPGGGSALLACRPSLQRLLAASAEADEQAAYRILLRALEQPMRTIARNAGYDPNLILACVEEAGSGYGLDATSGRVVPMVEAGVLDVATVLKRATFSAITTAALALTIEVVVQHRSPEKAAPVGP